MKRILLLTTVFMMMLGTSFSSAQTDADNFYKSDLVSVEKVSFSNQYKMKVAGNLFLPKNMKEGDKYPAIIVGHPMGAVKEQSANLYATKMAERGDFIVNPEGKVVAYEVISSNVGRNAEELLRRVQASQFVYAHGDQVCPANWTPGEETIEPSLDLVGQL